MKADNITALESLSTFCHICGYVSILLGIFIGGLALISSDYLHLNVGIFMVASGYALTKIADKISTIMIDEKIHG